MNEQTIVEEDVLEVNYSFGQRLSSARRALNMSQEQVATELRLNTMLIRALEEEDYTKLPTKMYIFGYLRNYARLLKIPVEPLLMALGKVKLTSPLLINDATRPKKDEYNKLLVTLFSVVLLVVIVAGIVSWVQMKPSSVMGENKADTVTDLPSALVTDSLIEEIIVEEKKVIDVMTKQASVESLEVIVDTVVTTTPVNVEKLKLAKDEVSLSLVFSDDCWVDIKDSRNNVLMYDLYRDGEIKTISGVPPFSVFLGNAAAVEIEYNGLAYDTSVHIRGKLARFKLGQK